MSEDLPPISVIVIGRNEGERLGRCLQSTRETDYPPGKIELIYVDSASTDGSCEVAATYNAKVIRIDPEYPTAAANRNTGWRAASHDLVMFLDGDTILQQGWLRAAARAMADLELMCVHGSLEELHPNGSIYNFWMHHDWYVPPGRVETAGGNAMFRRQVLAAVDGFDGTLVAGEERDLCTRLIRAVGGTIVRLDRPMALHDVNITRFGQYWRRCMRTGYAYAEVGGRHPGMRRWRLARWRNLVYAASLPVVGILCIVLWSYWPVALWMLWMAAAVTRNAVRLRRRVGSLQGALLVSTHHYISKVPAAVGQCSFWLRSAFHRKRRPLIEYR